MSLDAVALHDELLANQPANARHDAALCQICVDKAQLTASASVPSGSEPSGASDQQPTSTEGGTPDPMSGNDSASISRETHEALLAKAVTDAVKVTEDALARKTEEAAAAKSTVEEQAAEIEKLKADNARLNGDLDKAQIDLKSATDKVTTLEADLASRDEKAKLDEIAKARTTQVKNLELFDAKYIEDKAQDWARIPDEDWASRVEEWTALKPATTKPAEGAGDTASALTGTSEQLTNEPAGDTASEQKTPARRAVLGLS